MNKSTSFIDGNNNYFSGDSCICRIKLITTICAELFFLDTKKGENKVNESAENRGSEDERILRYA